MKPEFDREIDALLRGHARGGGGASATGGEARAFVRDLSAGERARDQAARLDTQAAHLDADELAAFAENALPTAARSRYAAHLADCDDCRHTATQLALAAGVTVVSDEREVVATEKIVGASWRERVAALIAPRAWRYAMPVVALLCVGVIALVVMRRVPRAGMQLARNNEEAQADRASPVSQEEHHAMTETAPPPEQPATQNVDDANAPVAASADARRGAVGGGDQMSAQTGGGVVKNESSVASNNAPAAANTQPPRSEDFSPPPPPASSVAASVPAAKPAPQPLAQLPEATPTPVNDESIAVTKDEPKPRKSEEVAEREQAQPKTRRAGGSRRDSQEVAVPEARDANRKALSDEAMRTPGSGVAGAASSKEQRKSAPSERGATESNAARDKSSDETRKVGGRKFRREGGAWIDTAYNSSQATVVVRRNSEQYRALVADEPEIARIANSLGGDVVIVWKGRAYRIKS
jgi:hypothetical protein